MASHEAAKLFSPLQVGKSALKHRIAMAPLTRYRANKAHVHGDLAVEYYKQRSALPGTLIVTEATFIAPAAAGYANVPGIWSDEQIAGWKRVVDAVHANGSFIYLQLWSLGRASKADVLKEEFGLPVVGAGDIPFEGGATPTALTKDEIKDFVGYYAQAAKNFVEGAGGDGVEIHGANGYLVDQFLQTTSNNRTDEYGGSVENRARFGLEVAAAVTAAIGEERTGIRLSPFSEFQGMKMPKEDITETFSYFVNELKTRFPSFSYIHVVEARIAGNADITPPPGETSDFLYQLWTPRPFLIAGGFKPDSALEEAKKRENTVVVFGRSYISTPDLPKRVKYGVELTPYDRSTFYIPESPKGYTDWPVAKELEGKA